jgi:hypothetical protein
VPMWFTRCGAKNVPGGGDRRSTIPGVRSCPMGTRLRPS